MPPSSPRVLPPQLFFVLLLLAVSTCTRANAQPRSRRALLDTLAPPPPHVHHRHTPPLSPPPQLLPPPPAQPTPIPTPTTPSQPTPISAPAAPPPPRHTKRKRPAPPPDSRPPPASAPPPTPTTTTTAPPPTPKFPSSSATNAAPEAYPFTNYPFFPTLGSPPPPAAAEQAQPSSSSGDNGVPTFPANISNLVAPTSRGSAPRHFPVLQALLLSFLSLCLLLLSALLSIHLFRRLRGHGRPPAATSSTSSAAHRRAADDDDDDEEGPRLKPPPMPTSSSNPSTEFLYLGTLSGPQPGPALPQPPAGSHLRPGSPELRPLPPLPRVGPPSGEFGSRSSASDPSTVPAAAAADASSSSLSPSSPSASSPTLGSSPVHIRPPSIPQPRGRAPNPSPPKRRPPLPPPNAAAEARATHAWNPFVAMPPQASPSDEDDSSEKSARKTRPLHSDKLKPGSLHMKDEMIHLYLNNPAAVAAPREVCVLAAQRCHDIGMVVGALGVSQDQVRDALLEGNAHGLGVEALQMISQLVLTNEEELKLRYFKDDPHAKLCSVEAFLKTILDVPFAFKRVDAMLYAAKFYLEVNQLRMSYATLEGACQELRSSRLFHKVLEAVLNFGNMMSINTGSPNSNALEPNTLLKIVDVKGADGKAALLQFVVQEIMKPEGYNPMHPVSTACKTNASAPQYDIECRRHGLQVVSKLAAELTNTKKASSIDIMQLSRNVSELGVGLGKIHDVLRLNSMVTSAESARRFHNAMSMFLRQSEEEILKLQAQESICLSSVKEMTEYFHGDSGNDEAHMFRIFTGVREFLAMLDRICKEAGEMDSNCISPMTANWTAAPMGMTP